ncbi:uncharacterized protein LOC120209812 [Hibiscus syriacus]|uniref:uncharacterized protein LOC120209812 n=1 Tax=Hibiscus syriacus TaxID=106335 RepID=UPI001923C237|nr:uncharacterized protein LOC120209812 [Hibiscus syriacus]
MSFSSFSAWLENMMLKLTVHRFIVLLVLLWRIWHRQNLFLFLIKVNCYQVFLFNDGRNLPWVLSRLTVGLVLEGQAIPILETHTTGIIEALAITRGIRLAVELELSSAVIESDSMNVVQQLQNPTNDRSTLRFYLLEARQILDAHRHISIPFTRREANSAAHALANYSTTSILPLF